MKLALSILVGIILLTGCGYDGSFRYSCQEPKSWNQQTNPECFPPDCEADGTCLRDIIPEEIYEEIIETDS